MCFIFSWFNVLSKYKLSGFFEKNKVRIEEISVTRVPDVICGAFCGIRHGSITWEYLHVNICKYLNMSII